MFTAQLKRDLRAYAPDLDGANPMVDYANALIEKLDRMIKQTFVQADRLAAAGGGPLAKLPHGTQSNDPDEIRARAEKNAPTGICDDATMQHPNSHVCPLPLESRQANREKVVAQLSSIGRSWFAAISKVYGDKKFEKLAAHGGAAVFMHILLDVALGYIGGELAGSLLTAGVAKASGQAAHAVRETLEHSADGAVSGGFHMVEEIGKKLGETVAGGKVNLGPGHHDDHEEKPDRLSTLKATFENVADAWEATAKSQVRLMTDPALVALSEALQRHPFPATHFEKKLKAIMANFDAVESAVGSGLTVDNTRPAYVVHPTGAVRLAIVTDEKKLRPFGKEQHYVPTGKTTIACWVDRSLGGVALDMARESRLSVMTAIGIDDHRWSADARKAIEPWARDPNGQHDVQFFSEEKPRSHHE